MTKPSELRPADGSELLAQTDWAAVQTPVLTVDVRRLEANIADVAQRFGDADITLRPHLKTSKCLDVVRRQLAAGAVGFTCSTPAEVQLLLDAGIGGLVWAHQPVGSAKVAQAVEFAAAGVMLIADSVAVAGPLAEAARAAGVTIDLLLEVDVGQHRTGVDPDQAVAVAQQMTAHSALRLAGVITHEGQLSRYGADRVALDAAASDVGALLASVAEDLRRNGFDCRIVSVGSTPGMASAPFASGVTEGRPGTYVFFDVNQVRLGSAQLGQCATSVLTSVVSVNRAGTAIVDAGLKAMSADTLTPDNGAGVVIDLQGNPLPDIHFETANEEHGFLVGAGVAALAVGDLVRVIPNHACGTTNMWSRMLAVHPDGRTQWWSIAARH